MQFHDLRPGEVLLLGDTIRVTLLEADEGEAVLEITDGETVRVERIRPPRLPRSSAAEPHARHRAPPLQLRRMELR
jgi:hypothetical protein